MCEDVISFATGGDVHKHITVLILSIAVAPLFSLCVKHLVLAL